MSMKKILFSLIMIAFCANIYAQNEKVSYKNIPLIGDIEVFCQNVISKGAKLLDSDKENAIYSLSDKLTGKDVHLSLYGTPKSKTVFMAVATYEEDAYWSSIKSHFNDLVAMLQEKYGKGDVIRKFDYPYEEGDGYELSAIRLDKCDYFAKFELKNGSINVMVTSGVFFDYEIRIYYVNTLGQELYDKEKQEINRAVNDL